VKLITVSILSWLVGLATYFSLVFTFFREEFTTEDLIPFTIIMTLAALLAFLLAGAPGMFWLRRRLGGYSPALFFPLVASALLTFVAAALSALGLFVFRAMVASEAILFCLAFLVMGAVFGMAFVWRYRGAPVNS
jgi:hypothetical protein